MKRFYNKKGFTLIECLIAIAVFAVMSSMVLVIISNAIQTAKKSAEAETELNSLVEYVEDNETIRKYTADSSVLKMRFDGNDLNYSVTYNNVSGYRNYIQCPYPDCGYIANNTDFMYHIMDTKCYQKFVQAQGGTDPYKIGNYFCPDDNAAGYSMTKTPGITALESGDNIDYLKKYWCPKCGRMLYRNSDVSAGHYAANKLKCYSCPNLASPYDDNQAGKTGFHYDQASCSFYCNACGSDDVMEQGTGERIGAASEFSVNGMYANAIRYGSVEQPSDSVAKGLVSGKNADDDTALSKFTVGFTVSNYSPTVPDVYTWTFYNYPTGVTKANFKIKMPAGYTIPLKAGSTTDYNITTSQCSAVWLPATNEIEVTDAQLNATIKFSFVNTVSSLPFESDYAKDGGLMKYWFKVDKSHGATTSHFDVPRTGLDSSS